ncbi:MAG: polyprenyl synthetase family protein [Halobacteriales archaeon]
MHDAREERVLAAVEKRRELVDEAIPAEIPVESPEKLWEASRHLLDAGGKRLRPTMLLLAAETVVDVGPLSRDYRTFPTLDGEPVDLLKAAVGVEVVHTFTLIHDDIMDDDDLRRGVASVHRAFDTETAIIAGDTLYSVAFELMLEAGGTSDRRLDALEQLATTCTRICEGQAMDVDFESRTDVVPDEYLTMIDRKTAVLYGTSASIPAMLVGADEETVAALERFSREVGQAFQIHDDVLDLTTPSEKLGKQRGSDLAEDKQTIITVHAREHGVDVDGLVDADEPADLEEAEMEAAVTRLNEAGSIDYAREVADDLVESGKDRLSVLPDNEARRTLEGIADYLVEREY